MKKSNDVPHHPLVYLDHNVLDDLIKCRADDLKVWLITSPVIPVVSNTNLVEIANSKGYEDRFLSLLDEIAACFIEEQTDENNRLLDRVLIYESDALTLREHMTLMPSNPLGPPTGFHGIIHKLFGGQADVPFMDIVKGEVDNIESETEVEGLDEDDTDFDNAIGVLTKMAFNVAREAMNHLGETMETESNTPGYRKFQEYRDASPRIINNLDSDNLIDAVIDQANNVFKEYGLSADEYLQAQGKIIQETYGRPQSLVDQIRSLYLLLSLFGYHRDPQIKKDEGYFKDMRDLEHVVMARYCALFFTKDKRLIKKATQIYKYLNLSTIVLHPSQFDTITFTSSDV